jgi:hypothetical protein
MQTRSSNHIGILSLATAISTVFVMILGAWHTKYSTNTVELAVARDKIPMWFELLVCINHLLVVSNSSFNFLIYLWASKRNSNQSNNILACPSFISWLRSLCGRLRTQQSSHRQRRQEQPHKHKFNANANSENINCEYFCVTF